MPKTKYQTESELATVLGRIFRAGIKRMLPLSMILDEARELKASPSFKRLAAYKRYAIGYTLYWHLYNDAWTYTEPQSVGPDGRIFLRTDDSWYLETTEYKNSLKCQFVYCADPFSIFVPAR